MAYNPFYDGGGEAAVADTPLYIDPALSSPSVQLSPEYQQWSPPPPIPEAQREIFEADYAKVGPQLERFSPFARAIAEANPALLHQQAVDAEIDALPVYHYKRLTYGPSQLMGEMEAASQAGFASLLPDRYGGFQPNLNALRARDVEGFTTAPPPMEEEIKRRTDAAASAGTVPWSTIPVVAGQGLARFIPKAAAAETFGRVTGPFLPEAITAGTLVKEGAMFAKWMLPIVRNVVRSVPSATAFAGLFGLDNQGNFSLKEGAKFGAMGLVGGAATGAVASAFAKAGENAVRPFLENKYVSMAAGHAANQIAMDLFMTIEQSPELVQMWKENPQAAINQMITIGGQNLAFLLFGIRELGRKHPSQIESILRAEGGRAAEMANRMLERRVNGGQTANEAMISVIRQAEPSFDIGGVRTGRPTVEYLSAVNDEGKVVRIPVPADPKARQQFYQKNYRPGMWLETAEAPPTTPSMEGMLRPYQQELEGLSELQSEVTGRGDLTRRAPWVSEVAENIFKTGKEAPAEPAEAPEPQPAAPPAPNPVAPVVSTPTITPTPAPAPPVAPAPQPVPAAPAAPAPAAPIKPPEMTAYGEVPPAELGAWKQAVYDAMKAHKPIAEQAVPGALERSDLVNEGYKFNTKNLTWEWQQPPPPELPKVFKPQPITTEPLSEDMAKRGKGKEPVVKGELETMPAPPPDVSEPENTIGWAARRALLDLGPADQLKSDPLGYAKALRRLWAFLPPETLAKPMSEMKFQDWIPFMQAFMERNPTVSQLKYMDFAIRKIYEQAMAAGQIEVPFTAFTKWRNLDATKAQLKFPEQKPAARRKPAKAETDDESDEVSDARPAPSNDEAIQIVDKVRELDPDAADVLLLQMLTGSRPNDLVSGALQKGETREQMEAKGRLTWKDVTERLAEGGRTGQSMGVVFGLPTVKTRGNPGAYRRYQKANQIGQAAVDRIRARRAAQGLPTGDNDPVFPWNLNIDSIKRPFDTAYLRDRAKQAQKLLGITTFDGDFFSPSGFRNLFGTIMGDLPGLDVDYLMGHTVSKTKSPAFAEEYLKTFVERRDPKGRRIFRKALDKRLTGYLEKLDAAWKENFGDWTGEPVRKTEEPEAKPAEPAPPQPTPKPEVPVPAPASAAPRAAEPTPPRAETPKPEAPKGAVTPKEQKKYLLTEIDRAIESAPRGELMQGEEAPKREFNAEEEDRRLAYNAYVRGRNIEMFGAVKIEVPGDGDFTVINERSALEAFRDRAKKFPMTGTQEKKTSQARSEPTKPAAVGKGDADDMAAALKLHVSTDESRYIINYAFSDGKVTVATDGRRMIIIKKGSGGSPEKPVVFVPGGQRIKLGKDEKPPNWNQVRPEEASLKPLFSDVETERIFTLLRQAQEATDDKNLSVRIFKNPDGTMGVRSGSSAADAEYESNVQEGAKVLTALNPQYALDAVNALRRLGNSKIQFLGSDELSPVVLRGKNADVIIMPMRLSAPPEWEALGKGGDINALQGKEERRTGEVTPTVGTEPGVHSEATTTPGSDLSKIDLSGAERLLSERHGSVPTDVFVRLLESGRIPISEQGRATLLAFARSGIFQRFPATQWMVRDNRLANGAPGSYENDLVGFTAWTETKIPIHEFFHHVYRFLTPNDQQLLREWRKRTLIDTMATTKDPLVMRIARRIYAGLDRREYVSPDSVIDEVSRAYPDDPNAPDNVRDEAGRKRTDAYNKVYHLINDSEYFTWLMSDRTLRKFSRDGVKLGFVTQIREMFRNLWHGLRSALGLTSDQDRLWERVVNGDYAYDWVKAKSYSESKGADYSPPDYHDLADRMEREANAQIKYASNPIVFAAQDMMRGVLAKETELNENFKSRKLYQRAKGMIKRIREAAITDRMLRSGNTISYEDAAEIVGRPGSEESAAEFFDYLRDNWDTISQQSSIRSGQNLENVVNLMDLQENINTEDRANRFAKLEMVRRALVTEMIPRVQSFMTGKAGQAEAVSELRREAEQIGKRIAKLRRDRPAVAALMDEKLDFIGRQMDLESATRLRRIPQMVSAFFKPLRESDGLEETFGKILSRFDRIMKMESSENPGQLEELKRVVATNAVKAFNAFDMAREDFNQFYEARKPQLEKLAQESRYKVANIRIRTGEAESAEQAAEIILSQIEDTMRGNPVDPSAQVSATTYSADRIKDLLSQRTAIVNFAKEVALRMRGFDQRYWEGDTTGSLLMRMLENKADAQLRISAEDTGVNPEAYNAIVKYLKESNEFRSGMEALINYFKPIEPSIANVKTYWASEARPEVLEAYIEEIYRLMASTNPDEVRRAELMAINLQESANKEVRLKGYALRSELRDLRKIETELRSLKMADDIFSSVANDPKLADLRREARDVSGQSKRLVEQSNSGLTLKRIGGRKYMPADISIGPGGSTVLDLKNYILKHDYFTKVEQYIEEFEALQRSMADPGTGKPGNPELATEAQKKALGIDPQKTFDYDEYYGAQDFIQRYAHEFNDTTAIFFDNRIQYSWLNRFMQKFGYFRQLLASGRMPQGVSARDFVANVVRWATDLNHAKAVVNRHRIRFLETRSAAMRSHPEIHNVIEDYKQKIFSEIAAEGRRMGSALKVGDRLPASPIPGVRVTQADMDFLQANRDFYEDYRKTVTEKGGRGVVMELKGANYVRKAAGVGTHGLPMNFGEMGTAAGNRIIDAYAHHFEVDRNGIPTGRLRPPSSDTSISSPDSRIQLWNDIAMARWVIRHILDSGREFRDIGQDVEMMEAERGLAAKLRDGWEWRAQLTNDDNSSFLEKLSNELAYGEFNGRRHLTGKTPEWVREKLLHELDQYMTNAREFIPEKQETTKAVVGSSGVESASEFTSPAAHFKMPSSMYDYGMVSDLDVVQTANRAVHEPSVELVSSFQRLQKALSEAIADVKQSGEFNTYYKGGSEEIKYLQTLFTNLEHDLKQTWDGTNPNVRNSANEFPTDLIRSSLLMGIPVNIRNVVLGQIEQAIATTALHMGKMANSLSILRGFKNIGVIAGHVMSDLIASPHLKVTNEVRRFLREILQTDLIPGARWAASTFLSNYNESQYKLLADMGLSNRSPFRQSIKAAWRSAWEYPTETERLKRTTKFGYVRSALGALRRSAAIGFRQVGTEYFDRAINAAAIPVIDHFETALKDAAFSYGRNHDINLPTFKSSRVPEDERLVIGNRFDPTKKFWDVHPDEFSHRLTGPARAKNTAEWVKFLAGADISLPYVLWRCYKATDGGRKAADFFTPEERERVRAAFIREGNAGDVLNRPLEARVNRWNRLLFTFQGWPSDFLTKVASVPLGTMGQSKTDKWIAAAPAIMGLITTAAVYGLLSQGLVGEYKKYLQRQPPNIATIFDKQFWTNPANLGDGVLTAIASSFPLLGDAILYAKGTLVNNRGYEPTGRILAFGVLDSLFNAMRGLWNLRNDPGSLPIPMRDLGIQWVGGMREAAAWLLPGYAEKREYGLSVGGAAHQADLLGIVRERSGNMKTGINYTPTYGIKEDLVASMMNRDYEALQQAYGKLVDYYREKGVEKPEQSAARDLNAMNPAYRALGGKRPTDEEWAKIRGGMTERQLTGLDKAISAWEWATGTLGVRGSLLAGGGGGGGMPAIAGAPGGLPTGTAPGALPSARAEASPAPVIRTGGGIGGRIAASLGRGSSALRSRISRFRVRPASGSRSRLSRLRLGSRRGIRLARGPSAPRMRTNRIRLASVRRRRLAYA